MDTTRYIERRHRQGSGAMLAGTLLMLVITGFLALVIYWLESEPLFGSPSDHLDGYFAVAIFAWAIAAGGAFWLWGRPIRSWLHHTQLIAPWLMLGVWAAVATNVDADSVTPTSRQPNFEFRSPSGTINVTVGRNSIRSDTHRLDSGIHKLSVHNDTGEGWIVAVLYSPSPFREEDIARDGSGCNTARSPDLADAPCVSSNFWIGLAQMSTFSTNFKPGYYAIAVRAPGADPAAEFAESGIEPIFITVTK